MATKKMETNTPSMPSTKSKAKKMTPVVIKSSGGICKTCSVLPVGSAELTTLMLVLVFSLVSVLFTAVLALNSQHAHVQLLEQQVKALQ